MMRSNTNRVAFGLSVVLTVVIVMVVLLGVAVTLLRRWHPFDQEYSELPPQQAFTLVFRRSVPPGVTDIQVAGYAWLGGRDIWMRFRATDEAVKLLARGSRPVSTPEKPYIGTAPVHEADPGKVHWEDVDRIHHPRCYDIDPAPGHTEWIRLIYDRQRHLAFSHLFDI